VSARRGLSHRAIQILVRLLGRWRDRGFDYLSLMTPLLLKYRWKAPKRGGAFCEIAPFGGTAFPAVPQTRSQTQRCRSSIEIKERSILERDADPERNGESRTGTAKKRASGLDLRRASARVRLFYPLWSGRNARGSRDNGTEVTRGRCR